MHNAGNSLGMPVPFLDAGLKNMSEHWTYKAGSCSDGLCCGCSLPCYTVLNEDIQKGHWHSHLAGKKLSDIFSWASLAKLLYHGNALDSKGGERSTHYTQPRLKPICNVLPNPNETQGFSKKNSPFPPSLCADIIKKVLR